MRRLLLIFSVLVLAAGSGHQVVFPVAGEEAGGAAEKEKKAKEVKLVLKGRPRQGFMPLRVSLNAELQGVDEKDAQYYCLREEWDFGDGAVSSEQPNCEEFTQDTKANLNFFAEHVFDEEGNYTIRFTLGDPVKVRSNMMTIVVLEREHGR